MKRTIHLHLLGIMLAGAPLCVSGQEQAPGKTEQAKNDVDLIELESRVQSVLDSVRQCTVGLSGGSGVVISSDGYILTCAHVARSAGRTVRVQFPDGRRVNAKTLGNYRDGDAGLVKIIEEGDWPYAEMGKSGPLNPGDWCLAVGYPVSFARGKLPPVRLGRVLRNSSNAVITDCPIMGGDSGGPLFDLDGRVIGISSRVAGTMLANIHVPVDMYQKYWDRLAAGEDWSDRSPQSSGRPRRPPMDDDSSSREESFEKLGLKLAQKDGRVHVTDVTEGGRAEAAGLRKGDLILQIGDADVKELARAKTRLQRSERNPVKVVVRRGETKITLSLTGAGS